MARLSSHLETSRRRAPARAFVTGPGLPALLVLCSQLLGCPASAPRVGSGSDDHDVIGFLDPNDPMCEQAKDDVLCRPEDSHERVELINHLAGCVPGPRGKATFSRGDEVLAELAPGQKKSVRLPRGDTTVTVRRVDATGAELTEEVHLSLAGKGPVPVEVGCPAGRFATSGLAPLVLWGPSSSCPPVRVRASGLDFELGPGVSWTLLVPLGDHVVRFGSVSQTVTVPALGAQLSAPSCVGVQGGRAAPRAAAVGPRAGRGLERDDRADR